LGVGLNSGYCDSKPVSRKIKEKRATRVEGGGQTEKRKENYQKGGSVVGGKGPFSGVQLVGGR